MARRKCDDPSTSKLRRTTGESCRRPSWSKNNSGRCSLPDPLPTRAAANDRLRKLVERAAGPEANRLGRAAVAERDRSPYCHRADNSESKSQQRRDQAHTTNRPGIHHRPQLQNAYPVSQWRQNSGMNISHGRTFTKNCELDQNIRALTRIDVLRVL